MTKVKLRRKNSYQNPLSTSLRPATSYNLTQHLESTTWGMHGYSLFQTRAMKLRVMKSLVQGHPSGFESRAGFEPSPTGRLSPRLVFAYATFQLRRRKGTGNQLRPKVLCGITAPQPSSRFEATLGCEHWAPGQSTAFPVHGTREAPFQGLTASVNLWINNQINGQANKQTGKLVPLPLLASANGQETFSIYVKV